MRVTLLVCLIAPLALILGTKPLCAQAPPSQSDQPSPAHAEHLYRIGKFAAAVEEYEALEAGSQAPLAYVGLARVYLKDKKPKDAYAAVAKAAELAPNLPETQIAIGEMDFRQGKIADAESVFVKVINTGSTNARAFFGLARVSIAASLYHRAKQMIDKAHVLDPADPDITRFWIEMLPMTDRAKALGDYLSGDTNDDSDTRKEMARELTILQDPSTATRDCRITSRISSTETDLKFLLLDSTHLRGFGLDVKMNGVSTRLLLDTGAGGILVNRKIAEKAGIKQVFQTEIGGIGDRGAAPGYVGYADSIRIGDLEFKDCPVEVIERNSAVGDEGLIGADVFENFLVDLDFADAKFRLNELPKRPGEPATDAKLDAGPNAPMQYYDRYVAPEMQSFSPVFRFGHNLLIPTALNNTASKLFLIDTGAITNTISPDAAREVAKVHGDPETEIYGLSGRVKKVYESGELTLTFGHLQQKNMDMISFDTKNMSDSMGTEVSGMLGFTMLRTLDIKIDYRDGLIAFGFDPKRWRR